METDDEIISVVILLLPALIQEGSLVNYWRKYVHKALVKHLENYACPGKSVSSLTVQPEMTLTVLTRE